MSRIEEITIRAVDGLNLSCLYSEALNPVALVQIIHGMSEHKQRYVNLINFLTNKGYSVIICDNRGHGKSVNQEYPLGHIDNIDLMVSDQYEVSKYIKERNKTKKLYIFAHSMGSLIARHYLYKYDTMIEKLILCGTVNYTPLSKIGIVLSKIIIRIKGKYHYSPLLFALSNDFSFKDDLSWLSYNEENIENYKKDPLCGFKFDSYSNLVLFSLVYKLKTKFKASNTELNILSLSGCDDRTTAHTKGILRSLNILKGYGYKKLDFIEFKDMKHEILNEKNNELVYKKIEEFFVGER